MSIEILKTPLQIERAPDRAYPHQVLDREHTPIARFVDADDAKSFVACVAQLQAHEEVLEALQKCESVLGQLLESPAHMAQAILAQGYATAARESARMALSANRTSRAVADGANEQTNEERDAEIERDRTGG